MERATGMMLEIDDTDNPEKESFRRDPSGRFGRREAGCERVTRVLVANEPRSYRQAIAAALQVIRPDMEVLVVEPELLDDEVAHAEADVVVCSEVTQLVRARATVWIDLYPGSGPLSVVCVKGRSSTCPDIEFADLIEVVDRAVSRRTVGG